MLNHISVTPRGALYLILLISLMSGVDEGYLIERGLPRSIWMIALYYILTSFSVFLWYRRDSDAMGYRRSRWLNTGIIFMAALAMPYYLARSRPGGRRWRALLKLVGFAFLILFFIVLGRVAGSVVSMGF